MSKSQIIQLFIYFIAGSLALARADEPKLVIVDNDVVVDHQKVDYGAIKVSCQNALIDGQSKVRIVTAFDYGRFKSLFVDSMIGPKPKLLRISNLRRLQLSTSRHGKPLRSSVV
jgi:hypothetical protein